MNKLRTTIGLALLGALALCAFAAQGAIAAEAKNTTAVTCVSGGGEKDFSDAHCDTNVGAGKGSFGHTAIAVGTKTSIYLTNAGTKNNTTEATNAVLKGTVFGVSLEITCKTAEGSGNLKNEEPSSKVHRVRGEVSVEFSNCTVNKPAVGCKVQPLQLIAPIESVEGLGAGKNEMGLEFWGSLFVQVILSECFMAGVYDVTGVAIATGTPSNTGKFSGSTNVFTNAMTKETLKLAGNSAEFSSTLTMSMLDLIGGNPIALTTAT